MRWDEVRDLLALQDRLDNLLAGRPAGWTPPVDLYETSDAYVLTVELPGLSREDVEIEARPDALTLRGTRPDPEVVPEHYHQLERGRGGFARTFAFAGPIDVNRVVADFRDGVLTVTVPKASGPGPRHITVD